MHYLKIDRDDASFPSAKRPFQALAPLKEKYIWPVFEFFFSSLKSVRVVFKHLEVSWNALVKKITHILWDQFMKGLKTMVLISLIIK